MPSGQQVRIVKPATARQKASGRHWHTWAPNHYSAKARNGSVIGFSWWLDTEWFYQLAKVRAPEMPPPQGSDKTREIQ